MKGLFLFLFSFLALSFGQDAKFHRSENGTVTATVDGRQLEPAWGYWYDRATTETYDPAGKLTPFRFEPAKFVMAQPEAVFSFFAGVAVPGLVQMQPISPPFAFATEGTAHAVTTVLKRWCPEFDYTVTEDDYTNTAGWKREPKNARTITFKSNGVSYGSLNAGLLANNIMRQPSLQGAMDVVRAECNMKLKEVR